MLPNPSSKVGSSPPPDPAQRALQRQPTKSFSKNFHHPGYRLIPPFHILLKISTMGDVAVENPANNVTPLPKPAALDALASLDSLEGTGTDGNDEYANLKRLQRHLELVMMRMPGSFSTLLTPPTGTFSCRRNTSRMSKGKRSQKAPGSGKRSLTALVEL